MRGRYLAVQKKVFTAQHMKTAKALLKAGLDPHEKNQAGEVRQTERTQTAPSLSAARLFAFGKFAWAVV
eukprot:SAG22_NODE_623_length_8459_cov_39.989474_7_plen_69_part_00